ncbi:LysR family transcriptional regulator [uncultured Cohaesibacter sp.]|uniref:LysR family transcriptional regulator n=1 Tax=uncultured Cohaesibacter sp. TaxID=1002546 RepID=UPI00292E6754|nr:LysR family transcriptional regulator [uncultured Cohaesibacter sp.]
MAVGPHTEIAAFLAVAHERSFTKAAAKQGVTTSALSHAVRGLEERLGIRLLTRTTRNVSTTEAGKRLQESVGPLFEQIDLQLSSLGDFRDHPVGKIRISCNDYVIDTIFRPKLNEFLRLYPDIQIEFVIDYGFTDIVEQGLDVGVRLGNAVSKDMIAMRIGPDFYFSVVGAPSYLAGVESPKVPADLMKFNCINRRSMTSGAFYPWRFEVEGEILNVRVNGQMAFNSVKPILDSALDGHGLAYLPDDLIAPYIEDGRLVRVLENSCPITEGYHLYYPNRHQASRAFRLFLEAVRYRS